MTTLISAWFNEEVIAPYFFAHYRGWIDNFIIILDEDTTDSTRQIIEAENNATIIPIKYPNGFDDQLKVDAINQAYRTVNDGWVIAVDSDELIFNVCRHLLELEIDATVFNVAMWDVYRHESDKDLTVSAPVIYQRRHGIPEIHPSYKKPVVVKAGQPISWGVGQHHLYHQLTKEKISETVLPGVHWQYADPAIVLARHTRNRKDRLSPENIARGQSLHFLEYTEDAVLERCKQHLNDPLLF